MADLKVEEKETVIETASVVDIADAKLVEKWEKKDRLHVRGLQGNYNLKEARAAIRALPRVIRFTEKDFSGGPVMWNKVIIDPKYGGNQTIYCHMKVFLPGTVSQIHGHQNDALMYVLDGEGYDVQDEIKIPWKAGDLAIIRGGTVHMHACTSETPARVFIFKGKSMVMFANLINQEIVTPASKEPIPGWDGFDPQNFKKKGE